MGTPRSPPHVHQSTQPECPSVDEWSKRVQFVHIPGGEGNPAVVTGRDAQREGSADRWHRVASSASAAAQLGDATAAVLSFPATAASSHFFDSLVNLQGFLPLSLAPFSSFPSSLCEDRTTDTVLGLVLIILRTPSFPSGDIYFLTHLLFLTCSELYAKLPFPFFITVFIRFTFLREYFLDMERPSSENIVWIP